MNRLMKMTLNERLDSLVSLGKYLENLDSSEISSACSMAETENPWFTRENVENALVAIRDQYLQKNILENIITTYGLNDQIQSKKIGLILAGNIPLVGFHDILCCYLTGHICLIKYSDKDKIMIPFLLRKLNEIKAESSGYFIETDKLIHYDGVIATGSNNTATHFEYYFRNVPHIIRRNRNSVAVLSGSESKEELRSLGNDVLGYFGLGCRNVSKIFVPAGYDVTILFSSFEAHFNIINHNKYKNNFDYNIALSLLNKEKFLNNEILLLKEAKPIISRIAGLHYEYYEDLAALSEELQNIRNEIQCVVSSMHIDGFESTPFGMAQCPSFTNFADDVDTLQFLLHI